MAKPKITRLGDPANPYTKKKVTASQAAASYRAAGKNAVRPGVAVPTPARKKKQTPKYETLLDRKIRRAGA